MAKYCGGCKSVYMEFLMGEFYRNSLKFYKGTVDDEDYFDPVVKMVGEAELEKRICGRFPAEALVDRDLAWFCEEERREPRNGRKYGDPALAFKHDSPTETLQGLWNDRELGSACRKLLIEIADGYVAERESCGESDALKARFDELARFFRLSDAELAMLKLVFVRGSTVFRFDPFSHGLRNNSLKNARIDFLAMCVDRSVPEVREMCGRRSQLRKYDFIDEDLDICGSVQEFLNGEDDKPLQGRFYRKAEVAEVLPWDFYSQSIRRHGEILKRMIRSRGGKKGVNILLYGEPGTGKTSLAMTLARDLGLDAYEIMHGDEDGKNTSLGSRLIGVQVCNEQMPKGSGLMIVDEADQILQTNRGGFMGLFGGGVSQSEKGQVNAMLDAIRVPTIWISNSPADAMDDSVRRRFDYSVCFHKLTHEMRVNIWKNNIRRLRLGRLVTSAMAEEFATRYATSAGGIAMVLENLKAMAPSAKEVPELVKRLMEPHCELMGTMAESGVLRPAKDYSLDGLNLKGDVELSCIADAVRNFYKDAEEAGPDSPRMNLLLWGPPGTGKTEYVKYLAKRLNRSVTVKMGSDLLSMWVGGTEKNIRNAFREAEESGSILFLDEIDGLVRDRAGASRGWEVTQVNELLYQMENFRGVMVAATNFMDNLDQAVLRRFTFKIEFGYLDEAGKRLFFERMFKTRLSPEDASSLDEVPNLSPGDFRTVRQSLYYLGKSVTNARRIAELARESAVKRDTKKPARIGF